jgi:predicted nucleic acid-binding Zn ribbon protein
MNTNIENRKCPECGKPIFGRVDKKFCSDACRNARNNKSNADATNYVRNVNNILRKNRRVLLDMNPKGKTKTHKDKMLTNGFNFDFYTNTYTTKAGQEYRYCYDQGYLMLEEGFVLLIVRKEF